MAVDAAKLPVAAHAAEDVGTIPQWKLMVRRFRKSKLSVAGLIMLIILMILIILIF